jgi:hypothetical protein
MPASSAANLTSIPAANITGTLPAISGANLTNLSSPQDMIFHGLEVTVYEDGTTCSVNAGKLCHGGTVISKAADTTLTFGTAGDWWDEEQDSYSGGIGWCYVGINGSGDVKLLGNNPPNRSDINGTTAGRLIYWYDTSVYWHVVGAFKINTSNQGWIPMIGHDRSVLTEYNVAVDGGTNTSWTAVNISAYVPAHARVVYGVASSNADTSYSDIYLASNDDVGGGEIGSMRLGTQHNGSTNAMLRTQFELLLLTPQSFDYKMGSGGANVRVEVHGWSY